MRGLLKRIFFAFCSMMLLSNMVFASGNEQIVITNISNSILDIIIWFGYAIMLGITIFIGIKYITSGANERANIKGMIPKYLIGAALIIMGFTIAQIVADIAGNDTAEEIIDVGANAGTPAVIGGSGGGEDDETNVTQTVTVAKGGNIVINHPSNLAINVHDVVGADPTLYAPLTYNGKSFSHWQITKTSLSDNTTETYTNSNSVYTLTGSDRLFFWGNAGAEYKYNVTPVYE